MIGRREGPVGEQVQVDDRVLARPLPVDEKQQGSRRDDRQYHDEVRFEPVFALAFIQDNLQRAQAHRHQAEPDVIDFRFRKLLALHEGRVLDQARGQDQGKNADGNIQEEDPAPGEVVGDPAAQSGADGRRQHHREAIDREGHAAFCGRKRIRQDGLFAGLQAAAPRALQYAEQNQHAQVRRQPAQERTDGEDGHAAHVETLASNDGRNPAAQRQDDGV